MFTIRISVNIKMTFIDAFNFWFIFFNFSCKICICKWKFIYLVLLLIITCKNVIMYLFNFRKHYRAKQTAFNLLKMFLCLFCWKFKCSLQNKNTIPKTKLYEFHKSERGIESLKGNKICLCYELKDRYHKDFCKSFEDFFKILRLQVFFVYTWVFHRF